MAFWNSKEWLSVNYKDDNGLPGFFLQGGYRGDRRSKANDDFIATVAILKDSSEPQLRHWCTLMEESSFMCLETATMDLFWLMKLRVGIATLERLRNEQDAFTSAMSGNSLVKTTQQKRALTPPASNMTPRKRKQVPRIEECDQSRELSPVNPPVTSSQAPQGQDDDEPLGSDSSSQGSSSDDDDVLDPEPHTTLTTISQSMKFVGRDNIFLKGMSQSIGTIVKRSALAQVDSYYTKSSGQKFYICCGMNNILNINLTESKVKQIPMSTHQTKFMKSIFALKKLSKNDRYAEFQQTLSKYDSDFDAIVRMLYKKMLKSLKQDLHVLKITAHMAELYHQHDEIALHHILKKSSDASFVNKIWSPLLHSLFYGSGLIVNWDSKLYVQHQNPIVEGQFFRIFCNMDSDSNIRYSKGQPEEQLAEMVLNAKMHLEELIPMETGIYKIRVALLLIQGCKARFLVLHKHTTDLYVLEELPSLFISSQATLFGPKMNILINRLLTIRELCIDGLNVLKELKVGQSAPHHARFNLDTIWYPPPLPSTTLRIKNEES